MFALVVGLALVANGISDLASFTIPETFLAILGLSQIVYIGGKLAAPPTVATLNKSTESLRQLERDFIGAAVDSPDPQSPVREPAKDLPTAILRAGPERYHAYLDLAKTVRTMFEEITGRKVHDEDILPSFSV
ncbi:MAG: hypothetical protein WA268_13285 [Xanthobacteraceae bacterium]